MLEQARAAYPDIAWRQEDIAAWAPDTPPDLIYSNAALQWLDDHETLLPRLVAMLAPGGTLAVQMPDNHDAVWNRLMTETAADPRFAPALGGYRRTRSVDTPERYHALLVGETRALSIWRTEYLHVLDGPDPVLNWTRGTSLRPMLDRLPAETHPAFEAAYADKLRAAYPQRDDGTTLFPFRRLFIIARR